MTEEKIRFRNLSWGLKIPLAIVWIYIVWVTVMLLFLAYAYLYF